MTTISLASGLAMLAWSQIRVIALEMQTAELMTRLSSTTSLCLLNKKQEQELLTKNKWLEEQLAVFETSRPGRKKHLAQLKKLLKQRNIEHGIGGN